MRFRQSFLAAALSFAVLGALAPVALADDAAPSGVKAEVLMWISDAESKLTQLAEAIPEKKYSWRPGKDVRSPGEVFMHVAAANYGVPGFFGVQPPQGFKIETYEKSLTQKADIQKALTASFQHLKSAIAGASDADLDKPVDLFGMKTTVRGAHLLLLTHAHEHLGQAIAYARVNNIVPPWSAREQAAAKEAEASKKAAAESK